MTGVFGGSSGAYVDVPLLEGEGIIYRRAASLLSHGVNMVPGQLLLTNQRLLFQPVNYGGLNKLIKLGLPLLSGGGGAILGALIEAAAGYQSNHTGTVPIDQIDSVKVGQKKANPIHPASLLINLKSGRSLEIAIYTSLGTIAFLPQHAVAGLRRVP
jgi:hypothetical protein